MHLDQHVLYAIVFDCYKVLLVCSFPESGLQAHW